jgi:hypothetical protein
MGFSAALYPTAGLFAATKALAGVYDDHVKDREVQAPLYARASRITLRSKSAICCSIAPRAFRAAGYLH